jgi:hypothetical protein
MCGGSLGGGSWGGAAAGAGGFVETVAGCAGFGCAGDGAEGTRAGGEAGAATINGFFSSTMMICLCRFGWDFVSNAGGSRLSGFFTGFEAGFFAGFIERFGRALAARFGPGLDLNRGFAGFVDFAGFLGFADLRPPAMRREMGIFFAGLGTGLGADLGLPLAGFFLAAFPAIFPAVFLEGFLADFALFFLEEVFFPAFAMVMKTKSRDIKLPRSEPSEHISRHAEKLEIVRGPGFDAVHDAGFEEGLGSPDYRADIGAEDDCAPGIIRPEHRERAEQVRRPLLENARAAQHEHVGCYRLHRKETV